MNDALPDETCAFREVGADASARARNTSKLFPGKNVNLAEAKFRVKILLPLLKGIVATRQKPGLSKYGNSDVFNKLEGSRAFSYVLGNSRTSELIKIFPKHEGLSEKCII